MKTYTWKELFDVLDKEESLREFILKFPAKYRKLVALALSVAHWHPSEFWELWERQNILSEDCGLCAYYAECCSQCPLTVVKQSCERQNSVWKQVRGAVIKDDTPTGYSMFTKAAYKMSRLLTKLYEEEYNRLAGERPK